MLEENFRRALLISRGSFGAFFLRPISGTLLALIGVVVVWQVAAFFLKARRPDEEPNVEPERVVLG
jgi:putative tricarboxylic transport membrane protein